MINVRLMYTWTETLTVSFAVIAIADFHGTAADTAHAQIRLARDGRP